MGSLTKMDSRNVARWIVLGGLVLLVGLFVFRRLPRPLVVARPIPSRGTRPSPRIEVADVYSYRSLDAAHKARSAFRPRGIQGRRWPAHLPESMEPFADMKQLAKAEPPIRSELSNLALKGGPEVAYATALEWIDGESSSLDGRLRILVAVRALSGLAVASASPALINDAASRLTAYLIDDSLPAAVRQESIAAIFGAATCCQRCYLNTLTRHLGFTDADEPDFRDDLLCAGPFISRVADPKTILDGLASIMRDAYPEHEDLSLSHANSDLSLSAAVALSVADYRMARLEVASLLDRKGGFGVPSPSQLANALTRSTHRESPLYRLMLDKAITHENPETRAGLLSGIVGIRDADDGMEFLPLLSENASKMTGESLRYKNETLVLGAEIADSILYVWDAASFSSYDEFSEYLTYQEASRPVYEAAVLYSLQIPGDEVSASWEGHINNCVDGLRDSIRIGDDAWAIPDLRLGRVLLDVLQKHKHLPRASRLLEMFQRREAELNEAEDRRRSLLDPGSSDNHY